MLTSLSRTAFIGRDEQIIAYRSFLSQSSSWLLLLTGMPGCGKSFFLKRMRELLLNTTLMLSLDFADTSLQTDPLTLLSELSWQCAQQCDTRTVEAFHAELEKSRRRLIQQYTEQVEDAADHFQQSPENTTLIETLLSDQQTQDAEIAIIGPVQQALLAQLATLPAGTHLTVIFDTCEWIIAPQGRRVGNWLLEQFLPALHQQCYCHVVMASRTPMPLADTLAASSMRIELEGLEETAITTYLREIGIQDDIGQHIYRITHGHPLCFAIITALWQEEYKNTPTATIDQEQNLAQLDEAYSTEALTELVQERLDQRLPSPYREWTHYGILLRRFNKDVLKSVFPELPCNDDDYQYFVDYLYIQPLEPGWYTIHEFLRETLFEIIRRKEPDRWQHYHQNAQRYYKQQEVPLSYEQYYHAVARNEIAGLNQWHKALQKALGLIASLRRTTIDPYATVLLHILDDKALQLSSEGKALYEDSKRDFTLQLDRQRKNEELQQQSVYDSEDTSSSRAKKAGNELAIRSRQKRISPLQWRSLRIAVLAIPLLLGYTIYSLLFPSSAPNLVTSLADSGTGSLRQVVANASPGSTITLVPQLRGTITLNDELTIDKNITILGADPQKIAITNGHRQNVHIHITSGATVFFGKLTFSHSLVMDKSFIYNEGNLTLNNCHVTENISYDNGGGITNQGGTMVITDSNINQNFASSNGGGIYSNNGTLTTSGSIISFNTAYENGGGIYSLTGTVNLGINTQITKNQAVHNDHSRGGGITATDALLNITGSTIIANWTQGFGGGISALGSIANIDSSVIVDNISSQAQGRELAVEIDPDNKKTSRVILADLKLPPYIGHPSSYIGHSQDNPADIIKGNITNESSRPEISSIGVNSNNPIGTPAPDQFSPPEASRNYLGNIDISAYCQSIHYASFNIDDPFSLKCIGSKGVQKVDALQICQAQYPGKNVTTDRLAGYFDHTSWQCYSNATKLEPGPIMTIENVQKFCQDAGNIGIYNNSRTTAYEWKCLHATSQLHSYYPIRLGNFPDEFPVGLSVDDMCGSFYHISSPAAVMDRLTDYNRPDGWECWKLLP